jgi:hypothetical protein
MKNVTFILWCIITLGSVAYYCKGSCLLGCLYTVFLLTLPFMLDKYNKDTQLPLNILLFTLLSITLSGTIVIISKTSSYYYFICFVTCYTYFSCFVAFMLLVKII